MIKIVPVLKGEDCSLSNNFRPVSLLSAFHKFLEKLMAIGLRVTNFLTINNILYKYQFGSEKNYSTLWLYNRRGGGYLRTFR